MTSTAASTDPAPADDAGGAQTPRGRAIVVGASSGLGAALVQRLAREGYHVAALARSGPGLDTLAREAESQPEARAAGGRVRAQVHDVSDTAAVPALFEELVRDLGGLDLLIYTAGIMPPVGPTEYDTVKDLEILAVNFGGLVAWGNQAAQLFRTQRSGVIVGVSSISGNRGRKGNPLYGASKAAMDNYLESLRNRLAGEGVHVCTIKPGYIATRMTEGMEGLFWVASPEDAAAAVLAAARSGANVRYVLRRWWFVGTLLPFIPSFVFRRLNF
ncbi:MAG: SDR family NAD(P)-dependent oxidoreductase [Planctomycetota bacterium]|jgi:NAD(P)-dependent dehydrogenase (short-subunit alcohol dehydrogenase family)